MELRQKKWSLEEKNRVESNLVEFGLNNGI